ncbi:MAG: 7-carboxy-7-deazaguanine synthase QueE [bacterium]
MTTLRVIEIFDSLQGEGYWTGVPMTFVRLAGCNAPGLGLGCVRWCDTPDSWDPTAGEQMDIGEIVRRVRLPRLCLTGGEPLLQLYGAAELIGEAHRQGIRVHLETNGTVDPQPILASPTPEGLAGEPGGGERGFDWATVSPKPPDYLIASGWDGMIDELKLVADERLGAATAERLAARHPGAVVCIQPEYGEGLDAKAGREAVDRAIALVMDHSEWRFSLQTHKLLGIR